ncbi:YihY/virulence factor BrkB family protein [Kamptonema sp. UHCC 0994]|uniref:YihY/virulence factor BrkB family protein n=1 Tax=Kamptonema sp. UHCC 0994 TaxID=3031329 RepID=UPI0023B9C388|nr:YihY/virulence factor BrkB family protein [Kamptonema sp. UHCC 0994]MDF0555518.1 YihY/virulence factor BrkB family protein [Kamptonema sp. UHCC 0994]
MKLKRIISLIKETFKEWQKDKAPTLAAALAFYTVFSLAPLLIIVIAIAGLVFGQEAAQGQLVGQLQSLVGKDGAETIQQLVANASNLKSGIVATIIGVATLLWGATNVFTNLKEALNMIWNVEPPPGRGFFGFLQDRILSFAMILSIGFLLLVSLVISAVLAAVNQWLNGLLHIPVGIWQLVDFGISFSVVTVLFALIYKFLPDVKLAWGDVWVGAAITSVLFTIGKSLIGIYLGSSGIGSTYGAAGSFVILLLWINYSAQILFLGAEFTQVWTNRYGSRMLARRKAQLEDDKMAISQSERNF